MIRVNKHSTTLAPQREDETSKDVTTTLQRLKSQMVLQHSQF